MLDLSFSLFDLEYFLLILVRVSCFVYVAPFFSLTGVPNQVKIGISFFTSLLLYETLTPAEVAITYNTVMGYAVIVMKEAVVGLILGFGATLCSAIVNFAGSITDMEIGLSMVNVLDPTTKQNTSISVVAKSQKHNYKLRQGGFVRLDARSTVFVETLKKELEYSR